MDTQAEADEKHKPGHIDSLNHEQEEQLKQIWKRLLQNTRNEDGVAKRNASAGMHSSVNGLPSKGGGNDHNISGADKAKKAGKDDQTKEAEASQEEENGMQELMAEHGPEQFHTAFWQYAMGEDPDALMLRFLRARKWDAGKAFAMLAATIKWRIETKVQDIIAAGEEGLCQHPGVKKNLSMAKCYFHGTDRQNRPVIYARVKHHKASDQDQEEMLKYVVLNMETSRVLLPVRSNVETASVVFDMSGFGLSNMDWDTATMVIKIFESYYPETLGHALIYNAPTVFSAVWRIVKPMLDPAVREKVHFASSASEMAKFVDPKHLEKDFGGVSSWRYRFRGPVPGENKHMEDEQTKAKRNAAYMKAAEEFENATQKWINGDSSAYRERRDVLVKAVTVRQLDLDPYVRGKTTFSRDGTIVGDGTVLWHYDHGRNEEFGKSAEDWAQQAGIEDPAERPRNKQEDDIVLSSDEDTESSTDDSENEILDDPHHRHHNVVAVGFAKMGNKTANALSHLTPGPSHNEKQQAKKDVKHKRHEERRAVKLEQKRKRIEAQRQREEEEEEAREAREEEENKQVEASYSDYLGRMANLSLCVGNKAADFVPAILGGNYIKAVTTTEEGSESTA